MSMQCLVMAETAHWRSAVKSEAEGFGRLTLVDAFKRSGKHKICYILFEIYDFGMWNEILVNDLGCRKGKCMG